MDIERQEELARKYVKEHGKKKAASILSEMFGFNITEEELKEFEPSKKITCLTKYSVDSLITVLNESIACLKKEQENETDMDKNYELLDVIKNAENNREIFLNVKDALDSSGDDTLCLMSRKSRK